MSALKDFLEIKDVQLKGILIAIALISPFWYLTIYLFSGSFVQNYPKELPIILTFCLSFLTFLEFIVFGFGFYLVLKEDISKKDTQLSLIRFSCIASITFLSIGLFLNYKNHFIGLFKLISNTFIILSIGAFLILFFGLTVFEIREKIKNRKVLND